MSVSSRKGQHCRRILVAGGDTYLRFPARSDQAEFLNAVKISRALHRPWLIPPSTPDAFEKYLARNERDDFKAFLLCRVADDAILGALNLSQIFRGTFQNAYLGYWVCATFARQGYMTDGIRLVLRYAFRILKLHRLEANVQPANVASKALLLRAGFRLEGFSPRYLKVCGRWRDHERWACREDL